MNKTTAAKLAKQLERDLLSQAGVLATGTVVSIKLANGAGVESRHVGTIVKTNVRYDGAWNGIVIRFADGEETLAAPGDVTPV